MTDSRSDEQPELALRGIKRKEEKGSQINKIVKR